MIIFPVHLFNPGSVKAGVRPRVIDGGTALNGDQDVISADGGGRWYIDYNDIALRTPQQERWWAQWESCLAGGARQVLVPLLSLRTAPRPVGAGRVMRVSELYTDDEVFPTIVQYASPHITAVTVGAVALRDTTMSVNVTQGSRIQGGESFSVAGRAYVIERVLSQMGQVATFTFSPPARASIASGVAVNFEWPTVVSRQVIGLDLIPQISYGHGTVSISFVEDFRDAS